MEVMFERFTDRARRAMVLAGYQGRRDDDNNVLIDGALLLNGVLAAQEPVVTGVLIPLGFVLDPSRDLAPDRTVPSAAQYKSVLGDDAKGALAAASEESEALDHSVIDTRHLLLGLMNVNPDLVSQQLSVAGVTMDVSHLRTELRTAH